MTSIVQSALKKLDESSHVDSSEYDIVGIRPSAEIFNMIDVLTFLHNESSLTSYFAEKISKKIAFYFANAMKTPEGVDLFFEIYDDILERDGKHVKDTAFNILCEITYDDSIDSIPKGKVAIISNYLELEDWGLACINDELKE